MRSPLRRTQKSVRENFWARTSLTNRMWFSVVCTLIDNGTRHHSGHSLRAGLTRL